MTYIVENINIYIVPYIIKFMIKNTTSINKEAIIKVLEHVKLKTPKFDIMIKNGKNLAGRAYCKGSGYHSTARPFIVCRIPDNFPRFFKTYQIGQFKNKTYYFLDRIEALVYIMAHEIRHIWQSRHKNKRGYVYGSKGKFSEIDTEAYAINRLRQWRKLEDKYA